MYVHRFVNSKDGDTKWMIFDESSLSRELLPYSHSLDVHTYICTHVNTKPSTHTYVHTTLNIRMYVCYNYSVDTYHDCHVHVCRYSRKVCTYVHTYKHMHKHMHKHMYKHMHMHSKYMHT